MPIDEENTSLTSADVYKIHADELRKSMAAKKDEKPFWRKPPKWFTRFFWAWVAVLLTSFSLGLLNMIWRGSFDAVAFINAILPHLVGK